MTKEHLRRGVVCALLAAIAAVFLAGRATDGTSAARGQGPPQGDRPVEQTRKNIKILKGLPDSQLLPLMNFISVSLGVQCTFCHVVERDAQAGQNRWLMERDDKPEKETARRMMQMVLDLNKGDVYGLTRGAVTCYTCHRGQEHPASLPSLPLAASGHEPAPGASPTPSPTPRPTPEAPPTVQQVYDRYVAALGGREAVAKFQTVTLKGTREASQGRNWPFEATLKGPDKALMTFEIPRQGTFMQALDGPGGWLKNPRSQRELSPTEFADVRRAAQFMGVVKFAPTQTMRVVGRRRFGDREAIVVVDRPTDKVTHRYFFDAQTGLLARVLTITDTVLVPLPEQMDFEDYREVEGVKIPFRIRVSAIDTFNSYTRTISEIRPGVAVEDTIFQMPAAPPAPRPQQ